MAIRTLEEWQELANVNIAQGGSWGQGVQDVLASWAFNKHNLELQVLKLENMVREYELEFQDLELRVQRLENIMKERNYETDTRTD